MIVNKDIKAINYRKYKEYLMKNDVYYKKMTDCCQEKRLHAREKDNRE